MSPLRRATLIIICMISSSVFAKAQEPVTRQWLEQMWEHENTRQFIEPAVKDHGIAFLPTDAVRQELLNQKHIDSGIVNLLTKHFARNLTFMVCKFTCDNCGSASSETVSFNNVVFDRAHYRKGLEGANLTDPLHGKTLFPSLADGPGADQSAFILVFVSGHLHKEHGAFRIVARLSYRDQGSSAHPLDEKDFVSASDGSHMREAASSIADWAIQILRQQTH